MNRYDQCCLLLLALLSFVGVALCEDAPENRGLQSSTFLGHVFGGSQGRAARDGRTFGHKRIQFMMMPMIYKMGVMMTMLAVLTVISLKGLMIGTILLVLKLSTIFGKLYAWHGQQGHSAPHHQPVHVHLHNDVGYGPHGPAQAYSGWDPAGAPPPGEEGYYYKG